MSYQIEQLRLLSTKGQDGQPSEDANDIRSRFENLLTDNTVWMEFLSVLAELVNPDDTAMDEAIRSSEHETMKLVIATLDKKVEEKARRKAERQQEKIRAIVASRLNYLPFPNVVIGTNYKAATISQVLSRCKTKFKEYTKPAMISGGLATVVYETKCTGMSTIAEHARYVGERDGFVSSPCVSMEVALAEHKEDRLYYELKEEHRNWFSSCVYEHGLFAHEGRVIWNTQDPVVKDLIRLMNNDAVTFQAYAAGLTAATIPNGLHHGVKIVVCNLGGGTDGATVCHPDIAEELGFRLAGDAQIRALGKDFFVKGLVRPDVEAWAWFYVANGSICQPELVIEEEVEGVKTYRHRHGKAIVKKPVFLMDYGCFKGLGKTLKAVKDAKAKGKLAVLTIETLGIISSVSKPNKIDGSFEFLENIKKTKRSVAWVEKQIGIFMKKIEEGGMPYIANQLREDSPDIALMMDIVEKMSTELKLEVRIDQIQHIKEAIQSLLQRRLWLANQGAAFKFSGYRAYMTRDWTAGEYFAGRKGIKRGEIYVPGVKPGTKVVVARYPMVLEQGIMVLRACERPTWAYGDGVKSAKGVSYIHPADMAIMFGDDDGDMLMISDDQELVKIVEKDRLSAGQPPVFVEPPKNDAIVIPLLDADGKLTLEGARYMASGHREGVGQLTLMRSRCLNAGLFKHARVLSALVQEAIDRAKRLVNWTDWEQALNEDHWKMDATKGGYVYVGPRLDGQAVQDIPLQDIQDWVRQALTNAGFSQSYIPQDGPYAGLECTKMLDPISSWRLNREKKCPIDPREWKDPEITISEWTPSPLSRGREAEIIRQWKDSLVQVSAKTAYDRWAAIYHKVMKTEGNEMALEEILPAYIQAKLKDFSETNEMSWEEYDKRGGLRDQIGIVEFRAALKKAWKIQPNEEGKDNGQEKALELAYANLRERAAAYASSHQETILKDLATVWWCENHYTYGASDDKEEDRWNGNSRNAFFAVTFRGSPVLELLGIKAAGECGYLQVAHIEGTVAHAFASPTGAVERLMTGIIQDTGHMEQEGKPLHECSFCIDRLSAAFVTGYRTRNVRTENHMLAGSIVRATNAWRHELNFMLDGPLKPLKAAETMKAATDEEVKEIRKWIYAWEKRNAKLWPATPSRKFAIEPGPVHAEKRAPRGARPNSNVREESVRPMNPNPNYLRIALYTGNRLDKETFMTEEVTRRFGSEKLKKRAEEQGYREVTFTKDPTKAAEWLLKAIRPQPEEPKTEQTPAPEAPREAQPSVGQNPTAATKPERANTQTSSSTPLKFCRIIFMVNGSVVWQKDYPFAVAKAMGGYELFTAEHQVRYNEVIPKENLVVKRINPVTSPGWQYLEISEKAAREVQA